MTASPPFGPLHYPASLDWMPLPPEHAEVDDLESFRVNRLTALQHRREADRVRGLALLLQERPALEGVYAPADFTVMSVRWCV